MKAPSKDDFLCEFGLAPCKEDHDLALLEYIFESRDGAIKIFFSFSLVYKSFQVIIEANSICVMTASSECIEEIKICNTAIGGEKCIKLIGCYKGAIGEGRITIDGVSGPCFVWGLLES